MQRPEQVRHRREPVQRMQPLSDRNGAASGPASPSGAVTTAAATSTGVTRLRPVLGLWDLVFYGIIVTMPIAAIPLFGVAQVLSHGQAASTLLIGMVAMLFTAVSYGRMAIRYPAAGSAYTYVSSGLNPYLGFLGGWAMFLMYLAIPISCVLYASLTMRRVVPSVPFVAWALLFAALMTGLNLFGIRTTARTNIALLAFMGIVSAAFVALAIHYLWVHGGWAELFSIQPFYDRRQFDLGALLTATSFSAFTYIGFDSPTTLAEDVENPRRNLLLATVLVCVFTGVISGLEVYLGQRVWPDYHSFPNIETAFMDVSRRVGGIPLFYAIWAVLIVANVGSGLGAQVGAARLLFGMGRDGVLPRRVFAAVNLRRNLPLYNICILGVLMFGGALALTYERTGEVLNFGAFVIFMAVNAAALRQLYFGAPGRGARRLWRDAVPPIAGFALCLWIWWSLPRIPKLLGAAWMLLGFAYELVSTRGFRRRPVVVDFREGA
jgi:putrescine importer